MFKIVVEDGGAGFDHRGELERAEKDVADASKRRGRGLLAVKRMSDDLEFSEKGNRVAATLGREHFDVGLDHAVAVSDGGVGRIGIVKVEGHLDTHTIGKFESAIQQAIRQGLDALIVDLSGCRYMSSIGIGSVLQLQSRLEEFGGRLVCAGASSSVRGVFELMGIASVVTMAASLEEARRLLES